MLLNLSNHPSVIWPQNQKNTALEQYGEVRDLPFPQIDSEWDTDLVRQLAEEYEGKIREINPTAVHIMGELTFCFILINMLKEIGIPCIASTTMRNVKEEKGIKVSAFEFVRFRGY